MEMIDRILDNNGAPKITLIVISTFIIISLFVGFICGDSAMDIFRWFGMSYLICYLIFVVVGVVIIAKYYTND